jgi:hypothetical protein
VCAQQARRSVAVLVVVCRWLATVLLLLPGRAPTVRAPVSVSLPWQSRLMAVGGCCGVLQWALLRCAGLLCLSRLVVATEL